MRSVFLDASNIEERRDGQYCPTVALTLVTYPDRPTIIRNYMDNRRHNHAL